MRIAINGLGRIGRHALKIALENNLKIVAVNDLTDTRTLAYLLKYDSVYGVYQKEIEIKKDSLIIDKKRIRVFSEPDPEKLPWRELGIDVVIESTGAFTTREGSQRHLKAGAKRVIISAPAKNPDITVVFGVNHKKIKKSHRIISCASCTTNALTPVVYVLHKNIGIKKGFMNTVHAYTPNQKILDSPHKKLRRGRAGAINIVPTTSGATSAVTEVLPELRGKIDGLALRVPVACGSIVDFVALVSKKTSVEEVNAMFKKASQKELRGIMEYCEDEIVSSDIINNKHSSIIDAPSTQVIGNLVRVLAWYDNEFGYSNRLIDTIKYLAKLK